MDSPEGLLVRARVMRRRLEDTNAKLQEKEKELYEKCVIAIMNNDEGLARCYANLCCELREESRDISRFITGLEKDISALEEKIPSSKSEVPVIRLGAYNREFF